MDLRLVIIRIMIMTMLLWLTKPSVLAFYNNNNNYTNIAKPNCKSKCGEVDIPYPFGIGRGCYIDDSFAIDCRNNNGSKPYLTRVDLEVLYISLHGHVKVNNPVISWGCGRDFNRTVVDLVNSSFVFSPTANRFVTVGCDVFALMKDPLSSIIGGCMTTCKLNNNKYDNSCYGVQCCQTPIPEDLWFFEAALGNIDLGNPSVCTSALLVDQDWFMFNLTEPLAVKDMTHVPVVLDWLLYNVPKSQAFEFDYGYGYGYVGSHCRLSRYNKTEFIPVNGTYIDSSTVPYFGYKCYCDVGFEGNPYLPYGCESTCLKDPTNRICRRRKDGKSKMVIIGLCSGLGVLLLLIGTWWLHKVMKKRHNIKCKEKFFKKNGGLLLEQQMSSSDGSVEKTKIFNSKELEKATDHYNEDRILGQGGQGTVYKGMLSDGRIVAVKKSKIDDGGNVNQFINEVVILSQINHRNVVKILGCCLETEVPLVVYEFVPNGTLLQHIHDPTEEFPLTWEMRLQIVTEVAGALSYLHNAASIPIYHRDIKSTNILLDDKYKAKVSDFGTSRSVAIDKTHLTTLVQGTFGYLDPEYFQSSQFTEKSDVYSFGVVIVELLTGLKAITSIRAMDGTRSLATYFIQSMEENRLDEILDPRILKDSRRQEMMVIARLAKRCLNLNGKMRPTMKEVAVELEGIRLAQGGYMTRETYEEVEYNTTDLTEAWDVASASTSTVESGATSSFDIQVLPLLHENS